MLSSQNTSSSSLKHPILASIQEIVLPSIEQNTGRIVPLVMPEAPRVAGGGFAEIFPFGLHSHDFYEWMWLLESDTHIHIGGTVHRLSRGDFCLLPPNILHAELNTSDTQPYQSLWCCYSGDSDLVYCTLCSIAPVGHLHASVYRIIHAPPLIGTLLVMIERELRSNQPHAEQVCHSLVSTLAHLLTRAFETSLALSSVDALSESIERRVVKYLNQSYADDIGLNDVARAVGMSRNYLCAAFKRETGDTVGDRLTRIRLERAKLLLLEGTLSVSEIAKAVGYESPARFSRAFQRHERIAPSRYGKW
jgi:AraC-like DNA-binding protein